MSDLPKRSLEAESTREEDWEVVSGAKSMSFEQKATSENKEIEEKAENVQTNENKIKEADKEEDNVLFKVVKHEYNAEDESEDWYQTIPATPMNTPEYTPAPPTYPSSNRVSDTGLEELAPITEETLEDQNPIASTVGGQTIAPQEVQGDSQSALSDILKQSLSIIRYTLTRLAIFIVGFSLIKWSLSKACEHLKKIKQSRSQTKKNID